MSGGKIERRLWQCPICERRFKIPSTAKEPVSCPQCADPSMTAGGQSNRIWQTSVECHSARSDDHHRNTKYAISALMCGLVASAYPTLITGPIGAIAAMFLGLLGIKSQKRGCAVGGIILGCFALLSFTVLTAAKSQARDSINQLLVHLQSTGEDDAPLMALLAEHTAKSVRHFFNNTEWWLWEASREQVESLPEPLQELRNALLEEDSTEFRLVRHTYEHRHDRLKNNHWTTVSNMGWIPFVGNILESWEYIALGQSAERLDQGRERDDDLARVAEFLNFNQKTRVLRLVHDKFEFWDWYRL